MKNTQYFINFCQRGFSFLLPGTLIAAFSVFCCGSTTRLESKFNAFLLNVVAGTLQLTTFLVIIGWIWSISWGMTFVQLASSYISLMINNPYYSLCYYY